MKKVLFYIVALLAGAILSIEGVIYTALGRHIGLLESSFYNFLAGSVILALLCLFLGKGEIGKIQVVPKWMLMGGVLGSAYLTAIIMVAPKLGMGITMVAVVAGQLFMSMVIEHKGWLGSMQVGMNRYHFGALFSLSLALVLM